MGGHGSIWMTSEGYAQCTYSTNDTSHNKRYFLDSIFSCYSISKGVIARYVSKSSFAERIQPIARFPIDYREMKAPGYARYVSGSHINMGLNLDVDPNDDDIYNYVRSALREFKYGN